MFTFGKDKKKKKPEKAPVWFMWLMGAFIIYALLSNIFTDKVSEVRPTAAEQTEGESINFAVVKGLSAGGPPLPLYSRDLRKGGGDMAECWFTVDVRYRLYNGEGEKVEEITAAEAPLRFTIGKGEVIPGLERGVLGMRVNGERVITARPELAFGQEKFTHPVLKKHDFVGYVLTMEHMQRPQSLPRSDLGLRIYDDREGDGLPVQCTDHARIRLRGFSINGTELFDKALELHIGEGKAPYAIERAAMGMKLGGKRTVIAPPGYMQPLFAETEKDDVEKSTETAEIQQTEQDSPASVADESAIKPDTGDAPQKTMWGGLPVPQDRAIILEMELLRPHVVEPKS